MFLEGPWPWVAFTLVVLALLAIDLGVFHRQAHAVPLKEAAAWVVVWVTLALTFNALLYWWRGPQSALEFFTGYVVELSLSVDNLFVFALIFAYFSVPPAFQHRVLFWGILGALIMRGAFIAAGTALLAHFHWAFYIFGGFLIFTGARMAFQKHEASEIKDNLLVRLVRRYLPVTNFYSGQQFLVRHNGKIMATPLLLVLVAVEGTDLVFAVDSVPAVFAVTRDPFIVYTSNVFGVLGLRSFYFLLAGVITKFYYLKFGLASVLCFVGAKMVAEDFYHVPITISLLIILGLLGLAVLASWIRNVMYSGRQLEQSPQPETDPDL
jgi:tellurite resistance protein TerC